MTTRPALLHLLDGAARGQLGVADRGALLAAGLSANTVDGLVKSGVLIRLHPGVYRTVGSPLSAHQRILTAVKAAGASALASHHTAAALHGLGSLTGTIDVIVPKRQNPVVRGAVIHHTRRLDATDVCMIGPIPSTAVPRTIIDLAAVVARGRLVWILDQALAAGLTSVSVVLARVDELGASGWSGVAFLRVLLDERKDEPEDAESVGELWTYRQLRDAGLPEPVSQYVVYDDRGEIVARPDLSYPWARLAIEYDGRKPHGNPVAAERDKERDIRLKAMGWEVLRVTKRMMKDPSPFLMAVRLRLEQFTR